MTTQDYKNAARFLRAFQLESKQHRFKWRFWVLSSHIRIEEAKMGSAAQTLVEKLSHLTINKI